MTNLEIVSHCWRYSRPLIFQLSSLWLFPPQRINVTMTVFYAESDTRTVEVLEFFRRKASPPTVALRPWMLPANTVTRRMIGRNLAALATTADWIWYTDCDYVFRDECLESLTGAIPADKGKLFFPRQVLASRCHEEGEEELRRVTSRLELVDIYSENYVPSRFGRAIGGLQITSGETARQMGYCRNSRFQNISSSKWAGHRDDIWFRQLLGSRGVPFDLPSLYRIRHRSRDGILLDGESADSTTPGESMAVI